MFQKHREIRVPGEGEMESGKQEEERVVISEKEAGARPQSICEEGAVETEVAWAAGEDTDLRFGRWCGQVQRQRHLWD